MRQKIRQILPLFAAAAILAGCVSTDVKTYVVRRREAPVERVAISMRSGKFADRNPASITGQKNVDSLMPSLAKRLPIVFTLNGLPAHLGEATIANPANGQQPPEPVLIVAPVFASYGMQTGQTLSINAILWGPAENADLWHAEITITTPGLESLGDDLADQLAVKLLEGLRADQVARLPAGPFRTQ